MKDEQSEIMALVKSSGLVCRLVGRIVSLHDGTRTLAITDSTGKPLLIGNLRECKFGYDERIRIEIEQKLAEWLPSNWDSLLVARFPEGAVVVLFAE